MSKFTPEMINAVTELVFLEYALNNIEDFTDAETARVKLLFEALALAAPKSVTALKSVTPDEVFAFLFEKYGV